MELELTLYLYMNLKSLANAIDCCCFCFVLFQILSSYIPFGNSVVRIIFYDTHQLAQMCRSLFCGNMIRIPLVS